MSQPTRPANTAAANNNNNNGSTPALQVNRRAAARQHLPMRMNDPNTAAGGMGDLAAQSADNVLGGAALSQKGSQQKASQQQQHRVVQAPSVLSLSGVRHLLLKATAGGREKLDELVVLDAQGNPTVANGAGPTAPANSASGTTTSENKNNNNNNNNNSVLDNVQAGDKVISALLEGCEPLLRHALEMVWLRVGRDTRRFVTEVQSCSEASLLQQRQRIHFGFEVSMDTLVTALAPTLAARLEQLPTTVYGVHASPQQSVNSSAVSLPGRVVRSNGASPQVALHQQNPPTSSAAAPLMNSNNNDNDDDDEQQPQTATSLGSSASRSAMRRQRLNTAPQQQEEQQQGEAPAPDNNNNNNNSNGGGDANGNSQQRLDKFVDGAAGGGATLFSPLRSNTNLVAPGVAAAAGTDGNNMNNSDMGITSPGDSNGNNNNNNNSNMVGGLVGVSRTVEDKVWVDVADLFCDAVSMMGACSRDRVTQLVYESLPEAMTEPWRGRMMQQQQQQQQVTRGFALGGDDDITMSSELMAARSGTASKTTLAARSFTKDDDDSCLSAVDDEGNNNSNSNDNSKKPKPGERADEPSFRSSTNSSTTQLTRQQQQQQQPNSFFDSTVFTANRDLRALLHSSLTSHTASEAERARQLLIDLLRAVSNKSRANNNADNDASSFLPRWTDGIPHNNGSSMFINEMLVAEYRTPYVDYLSGQQQPNLTLDMRVVLVDWLHAICTRLKMSDATFHLNVALLDRALALERDVGTRQLQLLGIAAMLLSSKYHEIAPPPVSSFVYMSANAYSSDDILTAERFLFSLLDAYVTYPSTLEAADLILAEQEPPATNEQRAFVHFLLHAHLHFHVYGGEGRVIEAARAAVFVSRCEFGMALASETMFAEQSSAAGTTTASLDTSSVSSNAGAGINNNSSSGNNSASKTQNPAAALRRRASNVSRMSTDSGANRSCSHLPFYHIDACFLSESEARMVGEIIDNVMTLRDPAKKAGDLVGRYQQQRYFNVASRPQAPDAVKQAAAAAAANAVTFTTMHLPRTPGSSTDSSPQSAKSLRGD